MRKHSHSDVEWDPGSELLVGVDSQDLDAGRLMLGASLMITMSGCLHSRLTPGLLGLKLIFSEIQLN